MADIQPPPTWAEIVLVDEKTGRGTFSPVWMKWFLDLAETLNLAGGTVLQHNNFIDIQGGTSGEFYHLTSAQHTDLTDGGNSTSHFHSTDRDRANHTGTQTKATISDLETLASGSYTPTLTEVTNLDDSTAYECHYMRVGDIVHVSGKVDVDPTAAAACELGISLPIASDFANDTDCAGVAAMPGVAQESGAIEADVANDRASLIWVATDTTNKTMGFTFTYKVL